MPAALLERLALAFRIVLLVIFVVLGLVSEQADTNDLELQAERSLHRRLDRAHIDWTQHEHQQQSNKLGLLDLPWRLWIDRSCDVRWQFGQLSAAVMLNAGLARPANFGRTS